jgi:hypothetical protein
MSNTNSESSSGSSVLPPLLHAMSEDSRSPSESLLVSSEDVADSALHAATVVLSPEEYPESRVLFCTNWLGPTHPVRPCRPLAADQCSHFRFTFHAHKVVTVEKFVDNTFEYSFAYEYWPIGGIKSVVTTRARLGVLLQQFDEVYV